MPKFESAFVVRAPLDAVWAFHADPEALPRIMTGPVRIRIHHVDRPLQAGSRIMMALRFGPFQVPWTVRVREIQPPEFFTDEQRTGEGPMHRWVHTHRFEPVDAHKTRVIDELDYEFPFGVLGRAAGALFGNLAMRLMFASRAAATRKLLERANG